MMQILNAGQFRYAFGNLCAERSEDYQCKLRARRDFPMNIRLQKPPENGQKEAKTRSYPTNGKM